MEKVAVEMPTMQACGEMMIEIECPHCEATIQSEPDATDLYCPECKMIVLQNSLTELGFM